MEELEKLKETYLKNVELNKATHDAAVTMGSLGVSPKHMVMYNESIRLIKEHEDRLNGVSQNGESRVCHKAVER